MTKLQELIAAEHRCLSSCHDYACARRGECTGGAGAELRSYNHEEERRRKEEQEFERQYHMFKKCADRYFAEQTYSKELPHD